MKITHEKKLTGVVVALSGELGHREGMEAIAYIGRIIDLYMPPALTLDLSGLTFMDSSGIAVVMNAYRGMRQIEGKLRLSGAPESALKVFRCAGIDRIVKFQ